MKNSKKLLGAIAALVVALAVSVGSTFAWFVSNEKVSIENIQATVTSGDSNLEVAFVNEKTGVVGTFGYSLDWAAWQEEVYASANLELKALSDASTKGLALKDKNGGTTDAVYSDTEQNYIKFTVRFRTTSAEDKTDGIKLNLTNTSSVESSHDEKKTPSILGWDEETLKTPWNIGTNQSITEKVAAANTVRVAFHKATVPTESGAVTNSGDGAGANGIVWEPNHDQGCYQEDASGNKLSQLVEEHLTGVAKGSLKTSYTTPEYGAVQFDTTTTKTTIATMQKVTAASDSDVTYYMADVTVVIWLEGTDGDCLNAILSDNLKIALSFAIDK